MWHPNLMGLIFVFNKFSSKSYGTKFKILVRCLGRMAPGKDIGNPAGLGQVIVS